MNHRKRPSEPPITGYSRTTAAPSYRWPAIICGAVVFLIAGIAVLVVLRTDNAARAADKAPVVASTKPTARPGTPVPQKPTEYSPPSPDELPGEGMWLVRKHIAPGLWQSEMGAVCYWERLGGLSGEPVDLLDNGGFRKGPLLVQVLATDYAFSSVGCGKWVRLR